MKEFMSNFDEYCILETDDNKYSKKLALIQQHTQIFNKFRESSIAFMVSCESLLPKSVPVSITSGKSDKSFSKLKKLDSPLFDNHTRSYARFKADFHSIVATELDPEYQAVYLRTQCTHGRAKSLIENLDTVEEMWSMLDQEYGCPEQLIHDVTERIRRLPVVKDNDAGNIINFVDTLRTAFNDLKLISAESALDNPMTIREVEHKMPEQLAIQWSEIVNTSAKDIVNKEENKEYKSKTKMVHLMEYLERERQKACYRLNVMGRKMPRVDEIKNPKPSYSKGQFNYMSDSFNEVNNCLFCKNERHFTRRCVKFLQQPLIKKQKLVADHNACVLCLQTGHQVDRCNFRLNNKWNPCRTCSEWHAHSLCPKRDHTNEISAGHADTHTNLENPNTNQKSGTAGYAYAESHDNFNSGIITNVAVNPLNNDEVLLPIQNVMISKGCYAYCLWDTGASGAIVNNTFAHNVGLVGTPISYNLTKVDGSVSVIHSQLYEVELIDVKNEVHVIHALGIDSIASKVQPYDMKYILSMFNLPSLEYSAIERNGGEIDILIGERYAGIHPQPYKVIDNLVLKKSLFGSGWLISGSCSKSYSEDSGLDVNVSFGKISDIKLLSLLSADSLGIEIPAKCVKCSNCQECNFHSEMLSFQDQYENELIDKGLQLDTVNNKWTASYPFIKSPSKLVDNMKNCERIFYSNEKRLMKKPDECSAYNKQFQDMIDRGVIIELNEEYLRNWKGPKFYLPHHGIYKDTSKSTPLRVVFNCATKDINGLSLNDCLAKGQNVLNDLLGVMLKFRKYLYVAVGDISKMFHCVSTTELEWNLHRLVFREIGSDTALKIMAIKVVSFGDRPAPAIAVSVLRKTVELYEYVNPEVARQLIQDSYMDDCILGSNNNDKLSQNIKDAEFITAKGNLHFKEWVKSGDELSALTVIPTSSDNRMLGLSWNAKTDELYYRVKIQFGKSSGKRFGNDLKYEEIDTCFPRILTKRQCLAVTNGIYDPLGLIQPYVVKLKLALRDIVIFSNTDTCLNWDSPIPEIMYKNWYEIIKELFSVEDLRFDRAIIPKNVDSTCKPMLITFSDGSSEALMSVCYIRWTLLNGEKIVRLVMSKCKVAPMVKLTLPRIELLGAVMNVRLAQSVKSHLQYEFERCVHIVDSSIVLAMIRTPSICYGEFMGCRVAEIQRKSNIDEWFWVESTENAADIGTRRTVSPELLKKGSCWQCGPEWLKKDFIEWPIFQSCDPDADLPEVKRKFEHLNIRVNAFSNVVEFEESSPEMVFKVNKYSNFKKLLVVTSIIFRIRDCMKNRNIQCNTLVTADELYNAELFWVKRIMILTKLSLDGGKLKPLCPIVKDGIVLIAGRAGQECSQYNQVHIPVLDPRHPVTKLYIKSVHEIRHTGIDQTVSLIRMKYWIPQCRKIVKTIKRNCILCRTIDKFHCEQIMKSLPNSRVKPGPVWYNTSLDLFGPLGIKDSVKKRVHGKCWGILFVCHASRAIYLTLTEDYSTDSFIQALQRFIYRNGSPRYIYSDRGSQLCGTSNEIKDYFEQLNFKQCERFAANFGFDWIFSPSKAPWYNGLAERFIATTKKQMKITIGCNVLTFGELETVLTNIEFLINSRPLFRYPDSDPLDRVGTPLDLLFGRSDIQPPRGLFDFNSSLTKRCRFQQGIVDEFWQKWIRQVYQYLVPYPKWRQEHRNLCTGDIVYMFNKDVTRGKYQLGVVDSVKIDDDNKVRRVIVKYKTKSSDFKTRFQYSERPVQNLVLIVPNNENNDKI